MSMTKTFIDALTTQAEAGDAAAQETLAEAGLWGDAGDDRERELWEGSDYGEEF